MLSLFSKSVVLSVQDGIAVATGLPSIKSGSLVIIGQKRIPGLVFNLNKESIKIVLLGTDSEVKAGSSVVDKNMYLSVEVNKVKFGGVVNPLGALLNGHSLATKKIKRKNTNSKAAQIMNIERPAVGIIHRKSVDTPLLTGLKVVDSLIPIGRGQRELIIGDRQTGKTTIAFDTVLNQKKKGEACASEVISIFVSIGQKVSSLVLAIENFFIKDCSKIIFVTAPASFPAPLQYIAPYSGCSFAEWFRGLGLDSLIIYDDLSKQAVSYRQMSLLLRRPPGREAYPGDIFYLHSRLLERAANVSSTKGGGSITALPIIETQAGDVSAFIPTNVISITDGQIFLDSNLFYRGIRPAVSVGLSVSRVGSAAQHKIMKVVSGSLKLELAQFREVEAFSQFDADLDEVTSRALLKGERLISTLIQKAWQPLALVSELIIIHSAMSGYLDQEKVELVQKIEYFLIFRPLPWLLNIAKRLDWFIVGYQIWNIDWKKDLSRAGISKSTALDSLLNYFILLTINFVNRA